VSARTVRTPVRLLVVAATAAAAVVVLAVVGLGEAAVYYRTPTEVLERPPAAGDRLRLGGLVLPGTVRSDGTTVRFELTDGVTGLTVVHRGDPSGVFQEGQGAVVEGVLGSDGRFLSDLVMVKHSNEYRAQDSR
jgi:cytochrome c-type biogenesis protein CcmE